MMFAYREYVSTFPGTNNYQLILRPVIAIRVVGPVANEGRGEEVQASAVS
jgi:hypothetical protein